MERIVDKIQWEQTENGKSQSYMLDIAVYPGNSQVFLIITGAQGTLDGYQNKYKRIAEHANSTSGVTVVVATNPVYSQKIFPEVMAYIDRYMCECDVPKYKISVMGHSAGGLYTAWYAWEYPKIDKFLLVNIPLSLNIHKTKAGISKFNGTATIVFGQRDPSYRYVEFLRLGDALSGGAKLIIIENADHGFSGMLEDFMALPKQYLL